MARRKVKKPKSGKRSARDIFYERITKGKIIVIKVRSGNVCVQLNNDGSFTTKVPHSPKMSNTDIREAVRPLENRALAANIIKIFLAGVVSYKYAKRIFPRYSFCPRGERFAPSSSIGWALHDTDQNPQPTEV